MYFLLFNSVAFRSPIECHVSRFLFAWPLQSEGRSNYGAGKYEYNGQKGWAGTGIRIVPKALYELGVRLRRCHQLRRRYLFPHEFFIFRSVRQPRASPSPSHSRATDAIEIRWSLRTSSSPPCAAI